MERGTRELLLALNRDFYETHAAAFDATRDHPWPGWQRVAERLPREGCAVLDAGCGNGRFARFLCAQGRTDLDYVGVDASDALLRAARARTPDASGQRFRFVRGDLFDAHTLPAGPFDAIVLFGVLHHVPGFDERVGLVVQLASRLAPGGFLAATIWRFGSDPRVKGRTLDWEAHPVAVDPTTLEPGDALLRWGESEDVARYCHFLDDAEIARLVEGTRSAGLEPIDRFRSDGRSGALNEYLLWSTARG